MKKLMLIFVVLFTSTAFLFSQRTISGVIQDELGESLIGANILVKGTDVGTSSDIDGRYSVNVPAGYDVLVISYTGYDLVEQKLGASNVINIVLTEGITVGEVVVTALGIKRDEKSLGYASSQVNSEELLKSGEQNTIQSLAGKSSGVNVVSSSGTPGASSKITLRGLASITNSSDPLIIVDGIPIDNSTPIPTAGDYPFNNGLQGVSNSNRLVDLNPDDIADVSILKGPAASALYGSEAGNGVIIITTKKGENAGTRLGINITSSIEVTQVSDLIELQDKYAAGTGGSYIAPADPGPDGLFFTADDVATGTQQSWGPALADDPSLSSFDNLGNFFDTGVSYKNGIEIFGANKKSNYRLSISDLRQSGIVPNSSFNRTTILLGAGWDITDKFRINSSLQYTNSGGNKVQNGSNLSGVMLSLYRTPITFDIRDYENEQGYTNNYFFIYDNPLWSAHKNTYDDEVNRVLGNIQMSYKFHDWFTPAVRFGIDQYSNSIENRIAYSSLGGFLSGGLGELNLFNIDNKKFNIDATATGGGDLSNDVRVNYLVGFNYRRDKNVNNYQRADLFTLPFLYNFSNAANLYASNELIETLKTGVYGQLTASFKNQIYLTGSLRNDWSSTLPINDNSFLSYGTNLSWVFSEMLENTDLISFGKLRVSYGSTGIEPAPYFTKTLSIIPNFTDGFTNGLSSPYLGQTLFGRNSRLGNPNLKAERVNGFEVGADIRLLDNRFRLDVSYYDQVTKDNLIFRQVPLSAGAQDIYGNFAEVSNKGLELELGFDILTKGKVQWTSSLNWSKNNNEVLNIEGPGEEDIVTTVETGFGGVSAVATKGQPIGVFQGSTWVRDDNNNLIIGANGLPSIGPDAILGNPTPDWFGGWRNNFTFFNDLSLSFLWDVRIGGDIYNGTKARLNRYGATKETEDRERMYIIEGVKADGTPNDIEITPVQYFGSYLGDNGGATEQIIEKDINIVRLRDVSLSYKFSDLNSNVFKNIVLSVRARNLALFHNYSGIDPETSLTGAGSLINGHDYFNNPGTRSYIFEVKVGF